MPKAAQAGEGEQMYRDAVGVAMPDYVFCWKNYLQKICGKEKYFEGGGALRESAGPAELAGSRWSCVSL
jgi:hypothetical protein